mgnify:CR=1 FL=1
MTVLPVEPAWRLSERKEEHRWLVAGLWGEQAVGIVGNVDHHNASLGKAGRNRWSVCCRRWTTSITSAAS